MGKNKSSKIKEINKGIKKIKDAPIKKRNPFFNDKALSENNRANAGPMKDSREGKGGDINYQQEYLKDLDVIEEQQIVEDEEHEFEI